MSFEFAVDYPCALRARYSEEHLRKWGQLSSIHTRLTTGDTSVPSDEKFRFIDESRDEIERLHNETAVCANCPACLPAKYSGEGESVPCLGRVNYPIEAQFEKFYADRVQLALDTVDVADQPRLLRILVDPESPFDGEGTKELRRVTTPNGLRFFELRLPIRLTREGAHLTTDHLFDLLAGFISEDARRTTYNRELPFEATADFYDFLDLILRNDLTATEHSRLHSRGHSYGQFLRLLAAIERAEALQTRVLMD